jgi:hypothetical protein
MNSDRISILEPREYLESTKPKTTAETPGFEADKPSDLVPGASGSPTRLPLFPEAELGDFRRRWQDTQSAFVDDPRNAVRAADELVGSVLTRLEQVFADERAKLEHEWDKGENVSTEDLRLALQRYRSFFDRLLSV